MPIIEQFQDIKARIAPGQQLMALDIGTKTIGVAVSDGSLTIATPVTTIRRTKFTQDIQELAKHMAGRTIGGVILGLPLNMDGSEGPKCQSVREFARNLERNMNIFSNPFAIGFFDERLSTAAMQRFMIDDYDLSRKKRGQHIDKMAAQFILQSVLDALPR